ncbi:MAG: DUF2339 domain-containing protein [Luteolibacter sp.]
MHNPDAFDGLRRRIDEMERRHARELAGLRAEIDDLEVDEMREEEVAAASPPPLPASVAGVSGPPLTAPQWEMPRDQTNVAEEMEPVVVDHEEIPPPLPPAAREIDFGRVWFVRIGVVILLTGLVFLGNYAYQNWIRDLGNEVRLAALVLLAGAWVETGRRLAKRENLLRFGEVVMAGGLGFSFYCVYAAHHVARLQVIDSMVVAGVLLVAAAVAITVVAWRRGSQITATLGILLASYTTVVQPLGWLACVSNGALACMGLFFLTRRGWSAPGWVAMLGMYLAFALWQVLGAAGRGSESLAVLWFLAPSWLLFAVAGVVPGGGESLSARARAWFAGANNGLFFGLFGALWIDHYGHEEFWMVAGVLAVVLIVFGLIGRRTLAVAGAVNLSQGLALLGLALILKLDGFHLALAFAAEATLLTAAYRKFGGRTEAVFALLAGVASALGMCFAFEEPPVWSAWVAVVALGAAAWMMRVAAGHERRRNFRDFARNYAALLFWAAWVVFTVGVLLRMDRDFAHVASAVAAVALGAASLGLDRKNRMLEIAWGVAAMLLVGFLLLGYEAVTHGVPWWAMLVAMAVHLTGVWLWRGEVDDPPVTFDNPRIDTRLNGGMHALITGAAAWAACENSGFANEVRFLLTMVAALGLAAVAVPIKTGRLAIVSGVLAVLAVVFAWLSLEMEVEPAWAFFTATPLALVALPLWFLLPVGWGIPLRGRMIGAVAFRFAAFVAWVVAVHRAGGIHALDGWAATAAALMLVAMVARVKIPLEAVAFLGIAVAGLYVKMLTGPWAQIEVTDGWRGGWVLAAMLLLLFTHRERVPLIADAQQRMVLIAMLASFTATTVTLWATQMLVWRAGWDGAVALWSAIGLLTVSAGLWQRLRGLRVAGLLLLLLALGKLFALDVWDYDAFTRVVSFIALGIALILLGLFYNHFASTLKKWL